MLKNGSPVRRSASHGRFDATTKSQPPALHPFTRLSRRIRRSGSGKFTSVKRYAALVSLVTLGVVLLVLLYRWIPPAGEVGMLDGRGLDVQYRSPADVYEQHAFYTAPLPNGHGGGVDGATRTNKDRALLAKASRRTIRQLALEEELNAYLKAHGMQRDRPIRVRFHILSNFVDWKLCTALGAASLAGFSIPITGFNATYSHIRRFDTYLDFVRREGLTDEDIVVTLDSDIFWTGADLMPFLKKFARFSPPTESELDVAAVRAWEDYGEKLAPTYMAKVQMAGPPNVKRPLMQMPAVVYNGDDLCWWGQHSSKFVRCQVAFAAMDHMIEAARNHKSTCSDPLLTKYARQCVNTVKQDLYESFTGNQRWMVDDMLGTPNATSPYTTQTEVPPSDPLFFHQGVTSGANKISLLNGGMHISRVWGLRYLASTLATYLKTEVPVPEAEDHHTSQWWCDQALFSEIYIRARIFEVEHDLLRGLPPAQRSPPVLHDPRFGVPGLFGVDRRSEMAVLAPTIERQRHLFHSGNYLDRQFPESTKWWVWNRTKALLGENWPSAEVMDELQMTRGGALVTPPLLWRSATAEDRTRGFVNEREDDPDTVHVPFIHYAAKAKHRRFSDHRNHYAWLVAARHDKRARDAAYNALQKEVVELWMNDRRVFVEYPRMCADPTLLASPDAKLKRHTS